jgi:polysaccharide biosynthesis protein PslH
MKPLRILIACAQAPLPDGTAAGRWCYSLIRGLVRRGHSVTALAACRDRAESEAANDLFSGWGFQLSCYPAPLRNPLASKIEALRRPFSYLFSKEMIARYRTESTRDYDVFHIDGTFGGYLITPSPDSRTVLHVQNLYCVDWPEDCCGNGQERIRRLLAVRAERKLIRCCRSVIAVTPQLARQVSLMNSGASVHFVPLALDPDQYVFIPKEKRPSRPVVSLIGSMDWFPSRSAAERLLRRLWPEIKRQRPDARLEITGRNARWALSDFLNQLDVEIHENVVSTQPYFEQATMLLYAPERGTGMKVKILEAFAMGVPVVTTPDGVEGLDAEDGVHAGIEETDRGLIDRALKLIADPAGQEKQRLAARRLLDTTYSPDPVLKRLEEVYGSFAPPATLISDRRDTALSAP